MVNAQQLSISASGFGQLPILKQLGILIGIAASIAIGGYVVLWSKEPNLIPMYAHLDSKEVYAVVEALQKSGVSYKVSEANGSVMVPAGKVHEVRMKLAALGLPKSTNSGFELLDKPAGFGTSQFMEAVRYKRSLEGELARTISSLDAVRGARVHLGLPKETSFIKRKSIASASVTLDLQTGYLLDAQQVAGIVHMVASSVPGLKHSKVTVIDQRGMLLSSKSDSNISNAIEEFNYTRELENVYARRIQDILSPILGSNSVKAEVTADVDFTFEEQTEEKFDSAKPVVRSEVTLNESSSLSGGVGGIPGALSNQPPIAGNATDGDIGQIEEAAQANDNGSGSKRRSATRNYEIDKSIKHVKHSMGELKRLSVAVVVNDKISYNNRGQETKTPLTEDEVKKIEGLVKDAIGFNEQRGDKVSVVNAQFASAPPVEAIPEKGIVEQDWFWPVVKQSLAGLFILILLFRVIKPLFRQMGQLNTIKNPERLESNTLNDQLAALKNLSIDDKTDYVKKLTQNDAKKASQVVMNWVGKEDD